MRFLYLLLSMIPFSAVADELPVRAAGMCHWFGERMPCDEAFNRLLAAPWFWPAVGGLLVVTLFYIVCHWKIFQKAGQPGWACLIPIYNTIVSFRIAQMSPWWILAFIVPFLNLYILIKVVHRTSRVFGHGVGFTLGLIFLSWIFVPILAFGNYTYRKLED